MLGVCWMKIQNIYEVTVNRTRGMLTCIQNENFARIQETLER